MTKSLVRAKFFTDEYFMPTKFSTDEFFTDKVFMEHIPISEIREKEKADKYHLFSFDRSLFFQGNSCGFENFITILDLSEFFAQKIHSIQEHWSHFGFSFSLICLASFYVNHVRPLPNIFLGILPSLKFTQKNGMNFSQPQARRFLV